MSFKSLWISTHSSTYTGIFLLFSTHIFGFRLNDLFSFCFVFFYSVRNVHTHTHICAYTLHTCAFTTAIGCIIPIPPMNGRLIAQTDTTLNYICDSSYVFRDTNESSRTLICTDRNIWDTSLPDCVGTLQAVKLAKSRLFHPAHLASNCIGSLTIGQSHSQVIQPLANHQ